MALQKQITDTGFKSIKSKQRVKQFAEVFTPPHIVKQMCDMLPAEAWELEKTILEPTCGNGAFLQEILKRKLQRCETQSDALRALDSIYGIDIQQDNVNESRELMERIVTERFGPSDQYRAILERRIICGDSLKIMKQLEGDGQWPQMPSSENRKE